MNLNTAIKKRTSVKNYSPKKVSYNQIINIIEAGNSAPSPGNLPIARFVVVEDNETINKLTEATQQPFINNAPFVIVICSESKRVKIMYDDRAEKYIKQHIGAVIENMLLKTTELGLASCWIGAFSDVTIKNALRIPDDAEVEAILPIAYPSKITKEKQKDKPGLDTRVFFDKYKNKFQKPFKKIRSH